VEAGAVELSAAWSPAWYGDRLQRVNRAVKRNASRFPADFMFELTADGAKILKCQIGISSSGSGHGGRRRSRPFAFTEQGVAMLSGSP
jgi:hypothetical protein